MIGAAPSTGFPGTDREMLNVMQNGVGASRFWVLLAAFRPSAIF
jgi:hypothetical protein